MLLDRIALIMIVAGAAACGTYGTPSNPAGTGAPNPPVKVTPIVNGTKQQIELNWVPQPTQGTNYTYNIYYTTNPNVSPYPSGTEDVAVGLPPTIIKNLVSGTTYYFVVTTFDLSSGLESVPSAPVVSAVAP
jgi:hypothetical protein